MKTQLMAGTSAIKLFPKKAMRGDEKNNNGMTWAKK
jgi:hypothetical protein